MRGPALCVCKQAVITHSVTFNNPIPSIILSVSPDNESNKNTNLLFQQKYLRAVHRLLVAIWQFAGLMMLRVEVYIGVCLRRCAVKYKWKCTFLLQYPRGHKFGQHHIIEWGYLFFSDQLFFKSSNSSVKTSNFFSLTAVRGDARTAKAERSLCKNVGEKQDP